MPATQQQTLTTLHQLLPVTQKFDKTCDTKHCLMNHPYFHYPNTIPQHMTAAADLAHETLNLNWPTPTLNTTQLHQLKKAAQGWRALGVIP